MKNMLLDTIKKNYPDGLEFTAKDLFDKMPADNMKSLEVINADFHRFLKAEHIVRIKRGVYILNSNGYSEDDDNQTDKVESDPSTYDENIKKLFDGYDEIYRDLESQAEKDIRTIRHEIIYFVQKCCSERRMEFKRNGGAPVESNGKVSGNSVDRAVV